MKVTITLALWFVSNSSGAAVPAAYRQVAEGHEIPPVLFYAMAVAESGTGAGGTVRPWPWTLNIAGVGHYYQSQHAARRALEAAVANGHTWVDVGPLQVSWHYHHRALESPAAALDPYFNLRVAAGILSRCHERTADWWKAVGCYHAPNDEARAARYRKRVRRIHDGFHVIE